MNVSQRAASRLRNLRSDDVAVILDTLIRRTFRPYTHMIAAMSSTYRCLVSRHKDVSLVLLDRIQEAA